MPTLQDMGCIDSLGIPKFGEQQARAIVQMVKNRRLLADKAPPPAATAQPRGIVIAGGGTYLSWAWTVCKRLRALGCQLPVQVWHLGSKEMPRWAVPLFTALNATPVDAYEVMKRHPMRQMSGWILKTYAVAHCPFNEVLFTDADAYPHPDIGNPEAMFDAPAPGHSLFFHDVKPCHPSPWGYVYAGLAPMPGGEWETGQFVVNKSTGWEGLLWSNWMNEHYDVWGKLVHGDKGIIELAFRIANSPFVMGDPPVWSGFGITHSANGTPLWEHKMATKRREHPPEPWLGALFKEWREITLGK